MIFFNKKNTIDQWGPIDSKVLYPSFWFKPTGMVMHNIKWPHLIGKADNNRLIFYWEKELMEKYGRDAIEKWIIPSRKLDKIWQEYTIIVKNINTSISAFDEIEINNKQDLKKITKLWYGYLILFWCSTLIPEIANFAAPKYLSEQLLDDNVSVKYINKIVEILLTPESLSFHQQNELELLKIYFNTNINKSKLLDDFTSKWYWVDNSYFETNFIDKNEWEKRLSSYSKVKAKKIFQDLQNYSKEVKLKKKNIIKKYKLDKKYLSISKNLSFSLWWQDHRKAKSWQAYDKVNLISEVMHKVYNIKKEDILYYTAEEWLALGSHGKKVNIKEIKNRKKYFIFFIKDAKYKILYGNKAKQFVRNLEKVIGVKKSKDIKGIVASPTKNKIIGKVKVVLSPRLVKKLNSNEILVAPMTSPDYIHLMRQAKAIITDIGGLMSHAAVVARELKKPCVIGTKIATKVLKDGDMVEIDASKGIIKKIK